MATKSPARPRSVAGRHRPVYHEVQPGGTSRGNAPHEAVVRGESAGLGRGAWLCLALITLLLVDTFWWNGYYVRHFWLALDQNSMASRAWAENLWN